VAEHLAVKTLQAVLEDWTPPFPGLRLYYPRHRHMTAGLRAFADMLREDRKLTAGSNPPAPRAASLRRDIALARRPCRLPFARMIDFLRPGTNVTKWLYLLGNRSRSDILDWLAASHFRERHFREDNG
jgi:hypothetical protein